MSEPDLNLLAVFDALFELRSVTRTAARLNLTQSAVSHALRRLRNALDDPLFVRAPGGLQPTMRASEMAPGIRQGLTQLRGALAPSVFVPESARRTFTIAAGSYVSALLVPELIARARIDAPGVRLRIVPVEPGLLIDLDNTAVDLAIGVFDTVPTRLTATPLFHEQLVWIIAAHHPLADAGLDAERLAALPHVTIRASRPFEPSRALFADGELESRSVNEIAAANSPIDPDVAVYDSVTAAAIVARTDLVALVPRRVAKRAAADGNVRILDATPGRDGIALAMLWHSKFDGDAGLAWLRGLLLDLAA